MLFRSSSEGDRIVLDLPGLSAGLTGSHHRPVDFRTKPPPASDHHAAIVYSNSTGLLIYESHGGAHGAAVRVAVLDNHPLLTAADLVIIG